MTQSASSTKQDPTPPPREPTAEEKAAAPAYLVGGAVFGAALIGFLAFVLDDEMKGTVLWYYGRYAGIGLFAWCGWMIGLGRGKAVAENVECLAIAVVMALILKHFLIEAYKIPTGSMQPTILGNDEQGIFDRVLVNKFSYLVDEPERYDVIVFKYPLDRSKNYIKRLIGLPGERLMIFHGDIFTATRDDAGGFGPWQIARKPASVRDAILKTIYPSGADGESFDDRFRVVLGSHQIDGDEIALAADSKIMFGQGESVRDRYLDGYDPDWGIAVPFHVPEFGEANCSDLAFGATVTAQDGARSVVLSLFADGIEHRAILDADGARIESGYRDTRGDGLLPVSVGAPVVVTSDGTIPLETGRSTDLRFLHVDQELVFEIDGEAALTFAYEIDRADASGGGDAILYPEPRGSENEIALAVTGGGARIEDVTVQRDIHYLTTNGRREQLFEVPDDGLLAMGDNTQNSSDGRMWRAQRVEFADGFETFRERNDMNAQSRRDFVDVYGERYQTKNGPAPNITPTDGDTFSFVPRNLLLGKAIAVFWPIVPHFRWKLIR